MKRLMKKYSILTLCAAAIVGCTVRQQDLDAWVGQPVEALDTQAFFLTLPLVKTVTASGIEIRNYVNGANVGRCYGSGNRFASSVNRVTYTAFQNCVSQFSACNNIFYIKDGKVLEYAPTASGRYRCYTDDSVLPNTKYLR